MFVLKYLNKIPKGILKTLITPFIGSLTIGILIAVIIYFKPNWFKWNLPIDKIKEKWNNFSEFTLKKKMIFLAWNILLLILILLMFSMLYNLSKALGKLIIILYTNLTVWIR